jgi:hypothetical protein
MIRTGGGALVGVVLGSAAAQPVITVNLGTIVTGLLTVITALAGAGFISSRRTRKLQDAERTKVEADTKSVTAATDTSTVISHAQYEGFISEAAQRLSAMNEAALGRMEKELADSLRQIAELKAELERAKTERNQAFADSRIKEIELSHEIDRLRDRIADLERRLEAQGITPRRRTDVHPDPVVPPKKDDG